MSNRKKFTKENKGFSLVELLVAITISAIVAGGIGYLLTTSLRMYNKDTVDVTLQQELQVTLNQIVDYAMESETIVADFDGTYPDYLALGTFESASGSGVLDKTKLDAQIIWKDGNKLYIKKTTIDDFCKSANPVDSDFRKIDKSKIESEIPSAGSSSDANLLAQYVTAFEVTGIGGIVEVKDEAGNVTGHAYENPLSIILELEFEKSVASADRNKKVEDTASLRNKVTNDIYVNIPSQSYQYCSLYEKNSVSIETTTVNMEKNAGILQIPGTDHGAVSYDLNILEIVPDYSYDYVQYVLGGEDGAILNTANTFYGSSAEEAGIKPISPSELEGFFIRSAGYRYNNNTTYGNSSFYPNIGADIPAMYTTPAKSRVGYYEYVGESNGGIYAIDSVTSNMEFANGAGFGDTKPVIDYFVHDSYGNTTDYTGKYYRPIFEYVGENEEKTDSWYYTVVSANEVTGGEYDKEILVINPETGTEYKEIYKYVGAPKGHYDLTFGWPKTTYGENNAFYRVFGDINDTFSAEKGRYYAHLTGDKWEYRSDKSVKTVGFDYNRNVEDVIMFSKYLDQTPAKSSDYGWIWHEEESGAVHDEIVSGARVTSASLIDTGNYVNYKSPSENNRIYLKDHIRNTVINNETFKLFTMQDIFEEYTPNKRLDIRYGIWDTANEQYCAVNKNALSSWEGSGHKVTLNVRIPKDVTDTDIKNCDLVIFGINGDGGFDYAKSLYDSIRGSVSAQNYSTTNDLSFANAFLLYKKVIAEEVGIACPYSLISAGGDKASTNIGKLFEMLYCVQNEDITKESIVDDTVTTAKLKKIEKQGESSNYWTVDPNYQKDLADRVMVQGSGREMFSDFFKSMADKALSKPLYNNNTLSHPTTEFVYIEESGENAGSIIVPAKNETVDGYVFNNSAKVIPTWGGGGGEGLSAFETNLLQWNTNKYLCDRYRAAFKGYEKSSFVWNPVYNKFYKFSYSEPQAGIYRNQVVWNQTSDLLHFSKSGGSGLLGIQTVRNNTKNEGAPIPADVIGKINYVGADLEAAAVERRNNQGDTSVKQFSEMPDYSMKIIDLPDYLADPSKPDTAITKKVLYLTEEQFKKAQTEGLYLYVLIKSSKDPSSYNKCVLWYEKNEKDAEGNPLKGRVDYVDFDYGNDNDESSENAVKYASGLLPDNSVNPAEMYVREYRYHVPAEYFRNLAPPYNNKNNMIVARVDKTAEKKYEGNDTLYIYIRDTFDLE